MRSLGIVEVCLFLLILQGGCITPDEPESEPGKDEVSGKFDWPYDYCEAFGWYDDAICDDFCPEPDPDCGPLCDDGSSLNPLCDMAPVCDEGLISATQNGCFVCVDPDTCEPPSSNCSDGTAVAETVFVDDGGDFECTQEELHCLTNDHSGCPQLSPLPPDYCPDGEIVSGSPSYLPAADGMECEMPSVHCVTQDHDACPLFSPLPPDYCQDGEIVQGAPSFIPSADGMECEIPSVHCISGTCD